jgi:hypothetical protein
MTDFWPDEIDETNITVPITILREQAELLGKKTKNIVKAEIVALAPSEPLLLERDEVKNESRVFRYAFLLLAPILDNYRYHLFSISHPINIYPLRFYLDGDIAQEIAPNHQSPTIASSEEEFSDTLKAIFGARKTVRAIQSMLAQSQGYKVAW